MFVFAKPTYFFFFSCAVVLLFFWIVFSILWTKQHMNGVAGIHDIFTTSEQKGVNLLLRDRIFTMIVSDQVPSTDLVLDTQELSHLADVARLYRVFSFFFSFTASLSWGVILYGLFVHAIRYEFFCALKRIFIILTCILISFLLFFPLTFSLFHILLFPGGNWQFAATSPMIGAFPVQFWFLEGFFIVLSSIFVMILLSRICTKN